MEIISYLRRNAVSALALVIAPVIAGGTAFFLLGGVPPRYEAAAEIEAPSSSGLSQVEVYAADLERRLVSPTVTGSVTAATGLASDQWRGGVQLDARERSYVVDVRFEGTERDTAARALEIGVRQAVLADVQRNLQDAERALEDVEPRYLQQREAVEGFRERIGSPRPLEEFEVLLREIRDQERELVLERARPQTPERAIEVAVLDQTVGEDRQRLDFLGSVISEYELLASDLRIAEERRKEARTRFVTAQSAFERTASGVEGVPIAVTERGNTREIVQAVIGAAAASEVLVLLVLAFRTGVQRSGESDRAGQEPAPRREPSRV